MTDMMIVLTILGGAIGYIVIGCLIGVYMLSRYNNHRIDTFYNDVGAILIAMVWPLSLPLLAMVLWPVWLTLWAIQKTSRLARRKTVTRVVK